MSCALVKDLVLWQDGTVGVESVDSEKVVLVG